MLKFKQIDEISKQLRDKYVERAVTAHGGYNMARRNTTGADQEYFARKEKNTQKGISRALDDKRKISEDASSAITDSGDRRQYNSLRAMQSDRLSKAKKSKDIVAQNHTRMAQQHGDAAEAILDKYRKESIDEAKATMCGRCGTKHVPPAQGGKCPALSEGMNDIPLKRETTVRRAIRRAQKTPPEVAKATYGVGYRQESVDEARGISTAATRAGLAKRKTTKPLTPEEQIAKDKMRFDKWKAKQQGKTVNEIKMTDDEYKDKVDSYGKRATNLLKHSWDQHDIGREKAKAGDKEGAAKATATGSRAHKLFLKARDKHLQNPEHAEANRKKIMSGASDYYKSKKPGEYTGDSFDPTLTNSNPYLGEGLVDEAREASYDGEYQSAVLRFREKAKKQEQERGPVDIQKLAARLKAVKLKPEGTKK